MIFGKYFCGNKISDYGLQNGRVDYLTFSKAFDCVLANDIMSKTYNIGYWEQVSGYTDDDDEEYANEVFQWYIVDERGAELCKEYNMILWYNEELDMYLWGIDHFGTSWDYVLTDIQCEKGE